MWSVVVSFHLKIVQNQTVRPLIGFLFLVFSVSLRAQVVNKSAPAESERVQLLATPLSHPVELKNQAKELNQLLFKTLFNLPKYQLVFTNSINENPAALNSQRLLFSSVKSGSGYELRFVLFDMNAAKVVAKSGRSASRDQYSREFVSALYEVFYGKGWADKNLPQDDERQSATKGNSQDLLQQAPPFDPPPSDLAKVQSPSQPNNKQKNNVEASGEQEASQKSKVLIPADVFDFEVLSFDEVKKLKDKALAESLKANQNKLANLSQGASESAESGGAESASSGTGAKDNANQKDLIAKASTSHKKTQDKGPQKNTNKPSKEAQISGSQNSESRNQQQSEEGFTQLETPLGTFDFKAEKSGATYFLKSAYSSYKSDADKFINVTTNLKILNFGLTRLYDDVKLKDAYRYILDLEISRDLVNKTYPIGLDYKATLIGQRHNLYGPLFLGAEASYQTMPFIFLQNLTQGFVISRTKVLWVGLNTGITAYLLKNKIDLFAGFKRSFFIQSDTLSDAEMIGAGANQLELSFHSDLFYNFGAYLRYSKSWLKNTDQNTPLTAEFSESMLGIYYKF